MPYLYEDVSHPLHTFGPPLNKVLYHSLQWKEIGWPTVKCLVVAHFQMEDLQDSSSLSDSTLQELYERNARLKETLKALEKGQHKSQIQNEQLKHQKMALQDLIGQLCKPSDASFGSQFSSPRHSGKESGNYGCTMTSQFHYRIPKLDFHWNGTNGVLIRED